MVLKRLPCATAHPSWFENDVKTYGTETLFFGHPVPKLFENDVKMYGTETQIRQLQYPLVFENDVKMYGTKTYKHHMRQTS